jgi:hypothetical protein
VTLQVVFFGRVNNYSAVSITVTLYSGDVLDLSLAHVCQCRGLFFFLIAVALSHLWSFVATATTVTTTTTVAIARSAQPPWPLLLND